MSKTLVAIAAAFLAFTTLCSAAEAGFKVRLGFGFPLGGFNAHHGGGYEHRRYRRHRYVVRRAKKKVHVAKAKTSAPKKIAAKKVAKKVAAKKDVVKVAAKKVEVKVAAKKVAPKRIAKVEPAVIAVPEPIVKTETENSSITTVAPIEPVSETSSTEIPGGTMPETDVTVDPVTPVADEPKAVNKLDCKKFFPSVGMTLSVSCE